MLITDRKIITKAHVLLYRTQTDPGKYPGPAVGRGVQFPGEGQGNHSRDRRYVQHRALSENPHREEHSDVPRVLPLAGEFEHLSG